MIKSIEVNNNTSKFINYSYLFFTSVLLIANCTCLYFWYLASKELNWIPTYSSIQDPASLEWPASYHNILDNAFIVGVFSTLVLLIIFSILFFKRGIVKPIPRIIGVVAILLFMYLLFGGFGDWWTD